MSSQPAMFGLQPSVSTGFSVFGTAPQKPPLTQTLDTKTITLQDEHFVKFQYYWHVNVETLKNLTITSPIISPRFGPKSLNSIQFYLSISLDPSHCYILNLIPLWGHKSELSFQYKINSKAFAKSSGIV